MYRKLGCLLVLASGAAHAGTMSFQLENADTFSGYLTLSGSGITINQSTYNSSTLSNYNISLLLDYGQGPIEFAVTGGNFILQNSTSTPTAYNAYGTDLLLSETVTNPGNTTGWRLVQYLDIVPGIPNDDVLRLTNLSTNVVYESVYPDAGPHIWRLTPARVPTISINVKPWDNTNTIDPTANNQVTVALLSTQIAANEEIDFDASQVDSNTVTFGPLQTGKTGGVWFTDMDQDSDTDLLMNFSNLNAGFLCEDSEAVVEGRSASGAYFVGADFITTPACETNSCHNDPAPARDTDRSPQRLVFLAKHPTNYPDEAHLYSAADNGSALIELSPPTPDSYADPVISYFVISPDKKWVAYQRSWYDINSGNLSELYVSAVDGSSRVKVSGAMVPGATIAANRFAWAPDSSRIAFIADAFTDNVMELFVVNRDGTNRVRINGTLPTGGDVFAFDWAPNSSQLAYSSDQTVDVYGEIWVAAADGSARHKVSATALPSGTGATNPRWSPDGNKILYEGTLFTPGVWQLFTVNIDGTSHSQISGPMVAGGGLYAPALNPWSGDSTQVLYYADQQTNETYELFAAAANGSGNVKVNGTLAVNADVPCCDTFSWSPDSNYVSYTANQSTVVDAYLWNRTTGTRTVLDSAGPTNVLHNAWSPNGQKLAFFGDSQSGVGWRKLYIANNDGGNATLASGTMSSGGSFAYYTNLVFNQRSYRPAWSPDSSRYLYAADKNIDGVLELFVATADGSRNIKVSEPVATGTGIDGHGFGWSSDGKKVIYIQDIGGMFALFSNDSVGGTPINLSGDLLVQGTAINYAGPTY